MKSNFLPILSFLSIAFLPVEGYSQNYIGFSKQYIVDAIKAERKDLRGPVVLNEDSVNYIIYTTRDTRRAIVYHFQSMPVTLDNGKQTETEICVQYYSKNKCLSYSKCPQMDEVMRSLDSHFEQGGTYLQWIDNSKRNPQEWMLVRDNDYFEVHVMELMR